MNIFAPQSIESQYELEEIADLKLQIITPQSSSPIIAMKQDQLLGAYNLTSEYYKLDWRTTMNLLASTEMESLDNVPKNKEYAGKEIYSYLIPKKINLMKGDPTKPTILVRNGIMESGILGDDSLGVKKSPSLVQLVWDEYGVEKTKTFLDNTTKLVNNFNLYHGMTVGIKDLNVTDELYNKMQQVFDTKKLEIQHEITEIENNPDMMDGNLFEVSVNQKLSVIRDDVSKVIMANMTKENNFRIMIESGSKGKPINITQMAGLVGQQDFHGGRILKNYNNRSLTYFFQNDDRAESRGFIERSFIHGLNISEFIFHHLSSREGLIDQTVRSVTPDTRITIIENSKPKTVEIGPWINSHIDSIIKTKPDQVERDVNEFELVNVSGISIPTVDSIGKVTWANVTAVTRHGKGAQLFEIVTRGGRKVKVPESKSLLIWNKETNQFEDKLTPDVVIGDFVPVTMNLPAPQVISNHVDMTEYFPKKEYIHGSDFIKAQEEIKLAMEGRDKIPAGWWERTNGTKFTLPYENKGRFMRVQSGRSDISNIKEGFIYPFCTTRDSSLPEKFILNKLNGQFIGLFLADGNVDWESGYIQITKSDEDVLKFVKKYFDTLDINYKENKRVTERGTIIDIRGYSRMLCKFLDTTCGHGAYDKHVPDFAFNAPEEFIIGLIDGYISGDGSLDKLSITASSCSLNLLNGINFLLNRLEIFAYISKFGYDNTERDIKANYDTYVTNIRAQWAHKFKIKIGTLLNGSKNTKLSNIKPSQKLHPHYEIQEDVILDEILEINQIDPKTYPKLYDLTVPGTFNFIISNGMGCRDTAESGYIQRKLIKSTEDFMVNYDGTVRNAVGRIQQFMYGESGADTVKQYEYKFQIMELSNSEVTDKFKFTKEELGKVKNFTESDNNKFYNNMLKCRDHLRSTQMKSTVEYKVLNIRYMLPVNMYRIINNIRNDPNKKGTVNYDCDLILKLIDKLLESKNTKLYCMTDEDMKDKSSVKYNDDQMAKTAFKYALLESLAPKKCIFGYKFSKEQLEEVFNQIISSFNASIVEPGEMVGIIAAQSLGEPVTQLMLNSLDWTEEILIHDSKLNKDTILPIGNFIDNLIENNKDKVTNPIDNLKAEMKDIYYLDTNDCNYQIKSVDEHGTVSWKKIEAVTKHLPINKDGTNTLIRVTTRTGKSVIATKGKSFLTQKNNKIVPIRGDEIKVGDFLPIMINYPKNELNNQYLDIGIYFPKDKYIYGSEIVKAKIIKNTNNANKVRHWFKGFNGKDYITPYSRQDSLKRVFDDNIDYREGCIYPCGSSTNSHLPEKIILDNDFGFFIGAYLAEGALSKTQICISNNDEKYRNNIIKFCNKYSIGYHIIYDSMDKVKMATTDRYEIRLHSTMLVKVINDICSKMSYNKFVPNIAYNAPDQFIKGLIDGYFSGDGTVYCKGSMNYISATSVSKKMLLGISLLLTKYGILTKLTTNKLIETNNLGTKNPRQSYSLTIRNKNIHKFHQNFILVEDNKQERINKISKYNFTKDNGFIEIVPSVKLNSSKQKSFNNNELRKLLETTTDMNDKNIIKQLLDYDVFMDEIVSIEEVQPTKTYVYDFTVQDTKTFIISNGLCCMDSFHSSGVGGKGGTSIGVDRIKEVFSLSKNPKEPIMMVYLNKEHRGKKDFANKIASHIKFTTIKDLRTKIEIYYDPKPYGSNGFMEKDNINTIFYTYQQSKQCCSNTIDGLPWLMRIEFDREKLLTKEVSLLDIKSQFCFSWEKRYLDIKSVKREKRSILEKISQLAVLSNTDNDDIPTVHLRFDMTNFSSSTLIDFMDLFVDDFKLKGMPNIDDIRGGGKAIEERYISFDNPEMALEKKNEYVVYTKGINMYDIRNIIGVDLSRTYCNDIITTYEIFGIEAARNLIIREIINVLSSNGSGTNYQHICMFGDLMTNQGTLTSIDRHGLNKLDTDPFSRASFEKTVDQLITAAVFNEVDHMKSVSSRIMAGLCIKGGTGLCDLVLDKDLLENSEYTIDIGQLYHKTYQDITVQQQQQEIDIEVFIPEL